MRWMFGNFFYGLYAAPDFLKFWRFLFFNRDIPKSRIWEVDLVKKEGRLVMGVTYFDDEKRAKVAQHSFPIEDAAKVYEHFDEFWYPVKEFYPPKRQSQIRDRLERLLNVRPSLREIDPRELYEDP